MKNTNVVKEISGSFTSRPMSSIVLQKLLWSRQTIGFHIGGNGPLKGYDLPYEIQNIFKRKHLLQGKSSEICQVGKCLQAKSCYQYVRYT